MKIKKSLFVVGVSSILITMTMCACVSTDSIGEVEKAIEATKEKEQIKETSIHIDKSTTDNSVEDNDVSINIDKSKDKIVDTYIDDRDINYYDYKAEYSYDKDYFNNDDKIKELEEQINELKKAQQSEQSTIIEEEKKEETIIQSQTETSQFTQQISNNMEPNMVTCDHCGRQGELYENITRWYSTNGNNHFTHAYCIENYIESTGVTPAQDLPNLR